MGEMKRRSQASRDTNVEFDAYTFPISPNKAIPRRRSLSLQEFNEQHLTSASPVVVEGAADWPAATLWKDPTYFRRKCGRADVPVEGATGGKPVVRMMTFKQFVNAHLLHRSPELGYISLHHLFDQIPLLTADIVIPSYVQAQLGGPFMTLASVGPANASTCLQRETRHTLLAQPVGHLYVRLYHATEAPRLYPFINNPFKRNLSQVNVDKPDLTLYPLFQSADYVECLLSPRDYLYIPQGYWSFLKNCTYSCTVTFWFDVQKTVPKPKKHQEAQGSRSTGSYE